MTNTKRYLFFMKQFVFVTIVFAIVTIIDSPNAFGQFIEDFGHIGTVKIFRGQVRDGLDDPIAGARLSLTNLKTNKTYSIDTDENGNFTKNSLQSGKYKVQVRGVGFNITEYTVTINKVSLKASKKYIIARLSPGCATGNSGVALVRKRNQPSFEP